MNLAEGNRKTPGSHSAPLIRSSVDLGLFAKYLLLSLGKLNRFSVSFLFLFLFSFFFNKKVNNRSFINLNFKFCSFAYLLETFLFLRKYERKNFPFQVITSSIVEGNL